MGPTPASFGSARHGSVTTPTSGRDGGVTPDADGRAVLDRSLPAPAEHDPAPPAEARTDAIEAGEATGAPPSLALVGQLARADGGPPGGPSSWGPGTPMTSGVRGRMEAVIGNDLSAVRLHTGGAGAAAAHRQRALAVTEGPHVAFAAGWYRPGTVVGDALLAHELAHTQQQAGSSARGGSEGDRRLEHEADRVGFAAVLRLIDPSSARPSTTTSSRQGLRLQRCSPDTYFTDRIRPLPDRAEYERRGELLPRGLSLGGPPLALGQGAGDLTLGLRQPADLTGPLQEIGLGLHPVPDDFGPAAPALPTDALMARLAAIELVDAELTRLIDGPDAAPPPLLRTPGGAFGNITEARSILRPDEQRFPLIIRDPSRTERVPEDLAELSREIVRAERVQAAAMRGLNDLRAIEADEELTAAQLPDYDHGRVRAEIADVRYAYTEAAWAVLMPSAVRRINRAIQMHSELKRMLVRMKLEHFQARTTTHDEIRGAVSELSDWAFDLDTRLTNLEQEASRLREAEDRSDPRFQAIQWQFAQTAQLIMLSIEALGEWDMAIQAYELLAGNSSLVGYGGVDDLTDRLSQMREAARADDVEYLGLLLRDHRADPAVGAFYASIPAMIQWSQFVIMLGITLITIVLAAPIGVAVGGLVGTALVGLGAAEGGLLVLTGTFLAHTAAEALVFTLITRHLTSRLPGMAPTGGFWHDFLWNWGLFIVLRGMSGAVKGAMAAGSRTAITATQLATSYAVLQAYGMIRFTVEAGRAMTPEEIGMMALQNLIMLRRSASRPARSPGRSPASRTASCSSASGSTSAAAWPRSMRSGPSSAAAPSRGSPTTPRRPVRSSPTSSPRRRCWRPASPASSRRSGRIPTSISGS